MNSFSFAIEPLVSEADEAISTHENLEAGRISSLIAELEQSIMVQI